jgi:hypothetical protein
MEEADGAEVAAVTTGVVEADGTEAVAAAAGLLNRDFFENLKRNCDGAAGGADEGMSVFAVEASARACKVVGMTSTVGCLIAAGNKPLIRLRDAALLVLLA